MSLKGLSNFPLIFNQKKLQIVAIFTNPSYDKTCVILQKSDNLITAYCF